MTFSVGNIFKACQIGRNLLVSIFIMCYQELTQAKKTSQQRQWKHDNFKTVSYDQRLQNIIIVIVTDVDAMSFQRFQRCVSTGEKPVVSWNAHTCISFFFHHIGWFRLLSETWLYIHRLYDVSFYSQVALFWRFEEIQGCITRTTGSPRGQQYFVP